MIHITNGRTDDIIGFFTQKDTTFNEHTQNLETYQDSFEFTSFGYHKYAHTLTDMNRIIIPAEDGGYSEYVIDTARKSRTRSSQVRVKSFASYQMLSVAKVIRPTSLSAYTPSQVLGFITNDTEWRPGITESNATRTFHIENHTDPLSFLKTVANEFDLEIRFRVETDGKRVTGRFIDLLERVGDWRGREITFGKDLDSIERTEEFGNIYTKLICLGPEDEEGNRLEIEVSDDDALRRWGRPHPITGELMHLEDTYEPTSERTDMTESELRQYGRTELDKRINSIVTYEAEVVDLENVPGMANKKIRFGDTVRIKDEKFNPPLYVEARIFEQRRDIFTKSNKRVKLGDFIEYTEDELRAVIDRLSKIIQTKIGQAQLVEHTYSKIEIDTKDEYVFGEGKTFAEAVGITAEDNAKQYATEQDVAVRNDAQGYATAAKSEAITLAEQDARTKAESAQRAAEAHADAKAEAERVLAEAYADGKVSAEEQARIDQANANLATAKSHAELKASEAEQAAKEYAELKAGVAETNAKSYADDASAEALQQALAESVAKDTYNAKIAQIASDLSEKAGITYVDGKLQIVDGAIADLNAEIETKADGSTVYTISEVDNMINNTVSKTQYTADINGIITDLETQGTQIGQNTEAIGLKADQTTVNALTGTVNSHSAQLLTMADEISARVTADYVQTAIDDVEIGGRNYFIRGNINNLAWASMNELLESSNFRGYSFPTPPNTDWTIYRKGTTNPRWRVYWFDHEPQAGSTPIGRAFSEDTEEAYVIRNMKSPSNVTWGFIYLSNIPVEVPDIMLEKGNKATDWTPAPEDVEAEISSLSAELSVQAGIISAKADSSTVNALGTRVNTAEQSINALDGAIQQRVTTTTYNAGLAGKENTVFKQNSAPAHSNGRLWLNTSVTPNILYRSTGSTWVKSTPTTAGEVGAYSSTQGNTLAGRVTTAESTITQHAKQIQLKVDDGDVRSIFTQEAGSFTFQANQINFDGHVFGGNATFTGKLQGSSIESSVFRTSYTPTDLTLPYGFMTLDDRKLSLVESQTINISDYNRFHTITEYDSTGLNYRWAREGIGQITSSVGPHGFEYDSRYSGGTNPKYLVKINHDVDGLLFTSDNSRFNGRITLPNAQGHNNALYFPNNNFISVTQAQDTFAFYGNRANGANPFSVRSHLGNVTNGSQFRTDLYVDSSGNTRVMGRLINQSAYDTTSATNANMVIVSNGYIARSSSAKKYKVDMQPANVDYRKVLDIEPYKWNDKAEVEENGGSTEGLRMYYGAIADHFVDVGLPEYGIYNEETGELENFNDRAWLLLIPNINDIKRDLEKLETENQLLKNEIKIIKERIA